MYARAKTTRGAPRRDAPKHARDDKLPPPPPRRTVECGASRAAGAPHFDVVVTFESKVMEVLVEDMNKKSGEGMHATLVVNVDVVDSAADAAFQKASEAIDVVRAAEANKRNAWFVEQAELASQAAMEVLARASP